MTWKKKKNENSKEMQTKKKTYETKRVLFTKLPFLIENIDQNMIIKIECEMSEKWRINQTKQNHHWTPKEPLTLSFS
jgi:hypothetical protein